MSSIIILSLVTLTMVFLQLYRPKVEASTKVFVYGKFYKFISTGFLLLIAFGNYSAFYIEKEWSFLSLIGWNFVFLILVAVSFVKFNTSVYIIERNLLQLTTVLSEKKIDLTKPYKYEHVQSKGNPSAEMWRIYQANNRIVIDKFIAGYDVLLENIPKEGPLVNYVFR